MPLRVVSFKADDKFIEKLLHASKSLGVNRSDLIRQAILKIISSLDNGGAIVCLELTSEEQLFLKLLSNDPVIALKKLLRNNMASSSWLMIAKGLMDND